MPAFVTSQPATAYHGFIFWLSLEGRTVAGFSKASGRHSQTRGFPGAPLETGEAQIITLEHGISQDAPFARWLLSAPDEATAQDLVLILRDLQGVPSKTWRFKACQVVALAALPDLDAAASAIAIARLELKIESWNAVPQGTG